MDTKNEYQANNALAARVTRGWVVGKNFSIPVVRKPQPKKSFWQKLKT